MRPQLHSGNPETNVGSVNTPLVGMIVKLQTIPLKKEKKKKS